MEVLGLKEIVDGISPKDLADEFLNWLINNVEQYIDNHKTKFIINISPKEAGDMPLAEKIEELYLGIDETHRFADAVDHDVDCDSLTDEERKAIDREVEMLNLLHDHVRRAYDALLANKDGLRGLFEKLVYYYEVVGFRNGVPIEKELTGAVNVSAFHYEPLEIPVEIKGRKPVYDKNGDLVEVRETEAVTYLIPPSFVIDLEIEIFEKRIQTSMF